MVRWKNGLVHNYGETSMAKWCTEYTPMFTWWNGYLVIWCGENYTNMKWCNGETIILTLDRRWFPGLLKRWGTIPLFHFIGWCITHLGKNHLWMMPRWFSKRPMSRCDTLWCCIPLISYDHFLLFILLFIFPATANTGGVRPLLHLTVSFHCLLYL